MRRSLALRSSHQDMLYRDRRFPNMCSVTISRVPSPTSEVKARLPLDTECTMSTQLLSWSPRRKERSPGRLHSRYRPNKRTRLVPNLLEAGHERKNPKSCTAQER